MSTDTKVAPTPGPWIVGPYYATDVESHEGRICECRPLTSDRAIANARLIAASPELLAALKAVAPDVCSLLCPSTWKTADGHPGHSEKCRSLTSAIAKAEGR